MGLREARKAKGWNQQCAARQLGVSQAYLSLLETGRRRPSARLSARLTRVFHLPATVVPAGAFRSMGADELVSDLAVLGYPGFQHFHRNTPLKNPAEVLLGALGADKLEPRLAEALPWVVYQYPDVDWNWLMPRTKAMDLQNRLGFVVTLGRRLAEQRGESNKATKLKAVETSLERSRLVHEDVFGRTSLTQAEDRWLREHRPEDARHWNVLSNMTVENLHVAS